MIPLERVTCHLVELPLVHPFQTSFGKEQRRRALLVQVSGEGAQGWGECVASSGPWYSYETVDTALLVIREFLLPLLAQARLSHPTQLQQVFAPVRGHPMAKAAVEAAVWDLYCRLKGVPLWRELGGVRDEVTAGVSIGIQPTIPELLARIHAFVDQGYPRVKLKVKPGWDIAVLEAVREEFPGIALQVDANCAYRPGDPTLREFDRFGLLLLEQPFHYQDLLEHARLAREIDTPVCLDESITSPHRAREALELKACSVMNVKQGRVGGLTPAVEIHELARGQGVPVWCGGMLETGVGRAVNVALATLPGFTLPNDISATDRYFQEDIAEPPFELTPRGTIPVPQGPGLGVEVVPQCLRRHRLQCWEFSLKDFRSPGPLRG